MATYSKHLLSGSVNGKCILISGTSAATAQTLHTHPGGTGSLDEVFLYACNVATSNATLYLLWGGTLNPDDTELALISANTGRNLVTDGRLVTNGLSITAYSSGTTIVMDGFVNRITS
jgi:hypothetical protein